jgi:Arc/MetJ-type ribon-helix-helix transcriptional regulator
MKTKKHDKRIALRLPSEQCEKINQLIDDRKFKNLSQLIKAALQEFLSERQ